MTSPIAPSRFFLLFLRVALAVGFLSAVADRLGLWGPPGTPGVAWGAWPPFVAYTAKLNFFAPAPVVAALAVLATVAEIILGVALLAGWWLRSTAALSALLLLAFAAAMTASGNVKGALDYSVLTATAAAALLAACSPDDALARRVRKMIGRA